MASVSEYGFSHLEGASAYSFDGAGSEHSSATVDTLSTEQHTHQHNLTKQLEASLSLNDGGDDDALGIVSSLYDDEFDGMLDDLNRELPPHACR